MKWWCLFCFTTVSWGFFEAINWYHFTKAVGVEGGVGVKSYFYWCAHCLHTEFLGQLRKGPLEARIWFLCIHGGKNTDSIYGKIIMLKALRVHRELPFENTRAWLDSEFLSLLEKYPQDLSCQLGTPSVSAGSCQLGSFLVPLFDSPFVE